jgi:hypothetical protein
MSISFWSTDKGQTYCACSPSFTNGIPGDGSPLVWITVLCGNNKWYNLGIGENARQSGSKRDHGK